MSGLKYDGGKPRIDLIPPQFLLELGQLCSNGAVKYAPRNWEQGLRWGQVYSSLQRHALAFWSAPAGGPYLDPETNIHHLVGVAWNAMALYHYSHVLPQWDDRKWHSFEQTPEDHEQLQMARAVSADAGLDMVLLLEQAYRAKQTP